MTRQKMVTCKSCHRKFLIPAVDTSRQEISYDMEGGGATFALVCPFCMAHAHHLYLIRLGITFLFLT
jgi:hypothetical protein